MIYGVSQSSGAERRLTLGRTGAGIVLTITDHVGGVERARIEVPADDLLDSVADPTPGGSTLEGRCPPQGDKMLLEIEVRRNEVQLHARAASGEGSDVAVGLDDFQDALAGAVSAE
jgi:hypothetical protein